MSDHLPEGYDDTNRAFLQSLMAHGTLTLAQARPILACLLNLKGDGEGEVTEDMVGQDVLDDYIEAAAQAVSAFDYEVRSTVNQVTRERVYALVDTAADLTTQLATPYSAEELAFIRRVLDAMFETYNSPRMELMCLTGMDAVKLRKPTAQQQQQQQQQQTQTQRDDEEGGGGAAGPSTQADKGLKTSEVEKVLSGLVAEGWFEHSAAGYYSLAPRALLELRAHLLESYNDAEAAEDEWQPVKFCVACRDLVTTGQRCAERDCNVRLHDICQEAFWRNRGEPKCPKCARAWDGKHFVGERAATTTDAYQRRRRSGAAAGPSGARRTRAGRQDGGEEEENGEEE
jgi:hypothetical protein